MTAPVFIAALPRSGTTFIANFLTHSGAFCWHEALLGCPDMDEYARRMSLRDYSVVGDSDSALCFYQDEVRERFPGALWVGIDRRPDEVMDSLCDDKVGGWPGLDHFDHMVAEHRRILQGCSLVIPFDTLFLTETLRNLWHTVTGLRFDERRAKMLADIQVQPHMPRYKQRYKAELPISMLPSEKVA